METQSKLFDKQYLSTRIRELKEIRRKEMAFNIEESNRIFSNSLYIVFYTRLQNGQLYKSRTLRLSDHLLENCPHEQFLVEPDEPLTKQKKAQFMKALALTIKKGQMRSFYRRLDEVSKKIKKHDEIV